MASAKVTESYLFIYLWIVEAEFLCVIALNILAHNL